jgi:hypothetical protein
MPELYPGKIEGQYQPGKIQIVLGPAPDYADAARGSFDRKGSPPLSRSR